MTLCADTVMTKLVVTGAADPNSSRLLYHFAWLKTNADATFTRVQVEVLQLPTERKGPTPPSPPLSLSLAHSLAQKQWLPRACSPPLGALSTPEGWPLGKCESHLLGVDDSAHLQLNPLTRHLSLEAL
jgi:hypothetical protein